MQVLAITVFQFAPTTITPDRDGLLWVSSVAYSQQHARTLMKLYIRQQTERHSQLDLSLLKHIRENEPSLSVCAAGGRCDRCGFERGANGGDSRGNSMEMQRWLCSKRL